MAVEQDFHAKVLTRKISPRLMTQAADEPAKETTGCRQHPFQVNLTWALSRMKNTIVSLLASCGVKMVEIGRFKN
ncbi:MAG: hypothetical protein ACU843_12725 [Gammaproteobacteria bacterium]